MGRAGFIVDSSRAIVSRTLPPQANSCAINERLVERHCFLGRVGIVVESGVRKG